MVKALLAVICAAVTIAAPPAHAAPELPGKDWYGSMSERERFLIEPRDAAWATVVEGYLTPRLRAEVTKLVAGFELQAVECRSSSCRVSWRPRSGVQSLTLTRLSAVLYGAWSGGGGKDGEMFLAFRDGPFAATRGDGVATVATIGRLRKSRLDKARSESGSGSRVPLPGIDVRALPAD